MNIFRTKVKTLKGDSTADLQDSVDYCPVCHRSIIPTVLQTVKMTVPRTHLWQILQCPDLDCQSPFVIKYRHSTQRGEFQSDYFYPYEWFPNHPKKQKFSENISQLSEEFVFIFNEAYHAEMSGLMKICGSGYRKALEFLIKQYCIHSHPDNADEIKKIHLGNCISKFISNENIKVCASRAAWLGNDETHFERLWESKDIRDLKTLIDLTVHHIDSEFKTKQYLSEMPSKP